MKIKYATISKMPISLFDPMPEVTAHYEDGSEEMLFQYYPDEIRFTPSEFVGLTREEAFALRHQKDTNYLQN
jgi:hypothetical protein